MSKYASAMAFILVLASMSSCGSSSGCRGGGWYGDRNLTELTPEEPNQMEVIELSEATSD